MPVDKCQHWRGVLGRAAGKHQMREQRGGPLQIIILDGLRGDLDGSIGSADSGHNALSHGFGRQRVQIDRVAVEKAVIALVYGPDVEGQRAVIAATVEGSDSQSGSSICAAISFGVSPVLARRSVWS